MIVVLMGLSALGGIFGKKKEREETKRRQEQQRTQSGMPPAHPPTAPRTPPAPPRPAEARQYTPAPPIVARPSTRQRLRLIPPPEPTMDVEPVLVEVELEPEIESGKKRPTPRRETPKRPARMRAAGPCRGNLADVRRMLCHKSALRAAFILTEILAPPVGLRDNQPV